MENFGSEIGQKMRSAVKAKLLELGTGGGSAGYIDDELPDYVMIMVANKRSKQQMINDLNLFLGVHTELFVVWLHEVLQKLQEVTYLPAGTVPKKRKSIHTEDSSSSKRDKKLTKKDKKSQHSQKELNSAGEPESNKNVDKATSVSTISSITDVFAGEILQKEKQLLEVSARTASHIKSNKGTSNVDGTFKLNKETNEFDIPTISEISSYACVDNVSTIQSRENDMDELARIQKKIYLAKKHLRQIGELDMGVESLDKDFIGESNHTASVKEIHIKSHRKSNSPIVFETENTRKISDGDQKSSHNRRTTRPLLSAAIKTAEFGIAESVAEAPKKRPVHERLGAKKIMPEQKRKRQDKTLSLTKNEPAKDAGQQQLHDLDKDNRNRTRNTNAPAHSSTKNYNFLDVKYEASQKLRQRIGSRVIVASKKHNDSTDDEAVAEKPMNSIIKIKPRPPVSPSKQASKNLLLRAVAEAQRSTTQIKVKESTCLQNNKIRDKIGVKTKIITKNFRKQSVNKINSPASFLKHKTQNFFIEVENEQGARLNKRYLKTTPMPKSSNEEEYVPMSNETEQTPDCVYVPQIVDNSNNSKAMSCDSNEYNLEDMTYSDESEGVEDNKTLPSQTQFVVTLTDEKNSHKYKGLKSNLHLQLPPIMHSQKNINLRTNNYRSRNIKSSAGLGLALNKKVSTMSLSIGKTTTTLASDFAEINLKPKYNKTIIRDDLTSSKKTVLNKPIKSLLRCDTLPIEVRSTTPPLPQNAVSTQRSIKSSSPKDMPVKQRHTPIKFDLNTDRIETKNQSNVDQQPVITRSSRRGEDHEQEKEMERLNEQRRKISIRTIEAKKYDNIPSLSSVSIDSTVSTVMKPKDRCKYHPNCTKQFCEFYHPTAPCKAFPICKYGDKCMYTHPKCKYEVSCTNMDCSFFHSEARNPNLLQTTAPPLSSHVVPVQNYKSISAVSSVSNSMCKYYPDCTKIGCSFYHPKSCRFGKNCVNKLECNFYHHDVQSSSKFKWVASAV